MKERNRANFWVCCRYDWQHGIQSRTWDPVVIKRTKLVEGQEKVLKLITSDMVERGTRISLTFRWTRSGPCECVYKTLCDSVENKSGDIEDDVASNLEELHVHQVSQLQLSLIKTENKKIGIC
jgi:hypothetical protein